MCRPASMLVGRTRVWWSPDHDSHEELIREAGLSDGLRGLDAVRVEITPPGGDYSLPLDVWQYRTDQDQVPDWYSAGEGEVAARAELAAWAAHHIVREGHAEVAEGQTRVLLGDATATVSRGEVWCYEQSTATVSGGEVWCRGQSTRIDV